MLHFDYIEPNTLEEAGRILSAEGVAGKIIAGGTDILVQVKEEKITVDRLVSLEKIPGLRGIGCDEEWVNIGAMTTLSEMETSDLIRGSVPILADAVEQIGSVQIRNRATPGGNICNAAPSADTIPGLLALRAEVAYWRSPEIRRCDLRHFFVGPGKTILERGDILTQIRFKKPHPLSAGAYLKLARRKGMDLPLLGIAVQLQMDAGLTRCEEVSVALGLAAPTPIRATNAEGVLKGKRITEAIMARAAEEAWRQAKPRDSFRCSAEYRGAMIKSLLPEVIKSAVSRIGKGMERQP